MRILKTNKFTVFLLGGFIMIGVILLTKNYHASGSPINISVKIDEKLENDIDVYINPHGYELTGYTPNKYIGSTNVVYPIIKESEIKDDYLEEISKYSDYNLYAVYKGQYAIVTTTNTLVLGDDKTNIEFNISLDRKEIPYLSVSNSTPIYQMIPSDEIGHISYFYDKKDFNKINPKSKKMLNSMKNISKL